MREAADQAASAWPMAKSRASAQARSSSATASAASAGVITEESSTVNARRSHTSAPATS